MITPTYPQPSCITPRLNNRTYPPTTYPQHLSASPTYLPQLKYLPNLPILLPTNARQAAPSSHSRTYLQRCVYLLYFIRRINYFVSFLFYEKDCTSLRFAFAMLAAKVFVLLFAWQFFDFSDPFDFASIKTGKHQRH